MYNTWYNNVSYEAIDNIYYYYWIIIALLYIDYILY